MSKSCQGAFCLRCVGDISRTKLGQCGNVLGIMQMSIFVPDVGRTTQMFPGCVGDRYGTRLGHVLVVHLLRTSIHTSRTYAWLQLKAIKDACFTQECYNPTNAG